MWKKTNQEKLTELIDRWIFKCDLNIWCCLNIFHIFTLVWLSQLLSIKLKPGDSPEITTGRRKHQTARIKQQTFKIKQQCQNKTNMRNKWQNRNQRNSFVFLKQNKDFRFKHVHLRTGTINQSLFVCSQVVRCERRLLLDDVQPDLLSVMKSFTPPEWTG